jgi:hypothetical protein
MIEEALRVLHEAGLARGAVDAAHVVLRNGGAQLVWRPELVNGARASDDVAAWGVTSRAQWRGAPVPVADSMARAAC